MWNEIQDSGHLHDGLPETGYTGNEFSVLITRCAQCFLRKPLAILRSLDLINEKFTGGKTLTQTVFRGICQFHKCGGLQ